MNTEQKHDLNQRVILITGASQGLGKAVALACARAGATVVLVAKNVKRLEAVYDLIEAEGCPQPAALPIDLLSATDHDIDQGLMQVRDQLGRLDGVIHCASHFVNLSPLENQTMQDWLDILRVNLVAAHALNRLALPLLLESPDASVLFTGETHGHTPTAYWGAYGVSKAALEALMKTSADEWEQHPNVRVNLLIPGPIDSPSRSKTHPAEPKNNLPSLSDIAQQHVYWMSAASKGRSGEITLI